MIIKPNGRLTLEDLFELKTSLVKVLAEWLGYGLDKGKNSSLLQSYE